MSVAEIVLLILQYGLKYGPEVGIAIAEAVQKGASIDDAIAALKLAQTKLPQDYVAEAQAKKDAETPPPTP